MAQMDGVVLRRVLQGTTGDIPNGRIGQHLFLLITLQIANNTSPHNRWFQ